jgi:cell volume regulation protein A
MIPLVFLLSGIIILVGFIGNIISNKTKLPESFYLIFVGILVGPIYNLIDVEFFKGISSVVTTLTLIIVLLQSGLSFDIYKLFKRLYKATIFTTLVVIFSSLFVSALMIYVFNWNPLYAILLGIVSSGTATVTVTHLISNLKLDLEIKEMLLLESIINNVTLVVGTSILIEIMKFGVVDITKLLEHLGSKVSNGLFFGAVFAIGLLYVFEKFLPKSKLNYVITIGVVFVTYSLIEMLGGNGIIGVFAFSLLLGNSVQLLKGIKRKTEKIEKIFRRVNKDIRKMGEEISFFLKTFFFVYLGLIFDLGSLSSYVLIICGLLVITLFSSRFLSSMVLSFLDSRYKKNWFIVSIMLPRGLLATLLAFLPTEFGIVVPHFTDIILLMIFFGTFMGILGSFIHGKFLSIKRA